MKCVLGIDTSNYTTSVCAINAVDGLMVVQARKMLPVKEGDRGLRQSDALFFHVRQLPEVMAELMSEFHRRGIEPTFERIGVSVRPRPYASSYMPVFQAGLSYAETLSIALGIPMTRTSHQEGHLAAAEYFHDMGTGPFVAVHLSGGTSDVMIAKRTTPGYAVDLVGEGADLHVGQLVDRVGVRLGLPFPAGPHLEKLSRQNQRERLQRATGNSLTISAPVQGASMSFSGPLSAAMRAIDAGCDEGEVAYAVETCIARAVSKAVEYAAREHGSVRKVLIAGGVASNQHIQTEVCARLERRLRDVQVRFAPPEYARDNALGVARIAYRQMQ